MKPEKARGTPQGFLESLEFCKKPWKSERGYGINRIVIVRKQLQGKTLVIGGIMPDQYFKRWNLMQQTIPAKEVKTVQTERFLCPNSGGNLRYDIKRQLYCCESCGSPDEIIPLHEGIREYPLDGYHGQEAQNVAFEGTSCVF